MHIHIFFLFPAFVNCSLGGLFFLNPFLDTHVKSEIEAPYRKPPKDCKVTSQQFTSLTYELLFLCRTILKIFKSCALIDGQCRSCRFCINHLLCQLSPIELASPEKTGKRNFWGGYFLLITHIWSPFNTAVTYKEILK